MAIRTPLSETIGIEIPFMQAGMGGIGPITLARLAAGQQLAAKGPKCGAASLSPSGRSS